jgi:hypothetical protein
MPKKIKVVDVAEPVETIEATPQAETIEPVETVEPSTQPETVETVEPIEVKKTRATRAPRVKKEVEQPKEETKQIDTSLLDVGVNMSDEKPEPEEPTEPTVKKNIKTVELVQCPKCNKKLTERTLKYSHDAVCPANEAKTIKKPKREPAAPKQEQYDEPIDEHIERPLMLRSKRIQVRSERYKNLITHAF